MSSVRYQRDDENLASLICVTWSPVNSLVALRRFVVTMYYEKSPDQINEMKLMQVVEFCLESTEIRVEWTRCHEQMITESLIFYHKSN